MSSKVGYSPGQGRTFTPSISCKWTDEFNYILEKENVSRNALTEELIELGLSTRNNKRIYIPSDGLTDDQIELLSSAEGQKILLNVALMLTGNSNANFLSGVLTSDASKGKHEDASLDLNEQKKEPEKPANKQVESAVEKARKMMRNVKMND